MEKYVFKLIEKKWQKIWEEESYGKAEDFSKKPKHYHLVEFPYPSGEGLHIGHCMSYGASDAYCRMKRMQGFEVMFPMGWDAFGLPTENFAIKNKVKPQDATKKNIDNYRRQMKSLGYSFDWSREVNTTDPTYYKWTQWIFLQFYKHGIVDGKLIEVLDDDTETPRLAYQAEMPVNWCPSCKINLANEEVVGGGCERCGTPTIKKMQKQWMLRITSYADRLITDLDKVDYLDKIKTQQLNWIGKSEGANIKFEIRSSKSETNSKSQIINSKQYIDVFTTRADTLFGCTYVVLAPEHPLINKIKNKISNIKEVEEYIDKATRKSDLERAEIEKEKTGVELKGISTTNPINNEKIPVWIADYVLLTYGTGAVMAVPAHDQRDFEFAKKYEIRIKMVICPNYPNPVCPVLEKAFEDYGHLVDSGEFDGFTSKDAQKKITEKLKEIGAGDFGINYKLRDWIFSRQHYWGEPIPIVHCEKCGVVALDEKDLPLKLPEIEHYEPTDTGESPLAKISEWVNTKCPGCDGEAKRETDTMPNWAGSSWYYLRYCDPKNTNSLADQKILDFWMPVDLYNGGVEHTTLHLLYSRFWHKFLYDLKVVPGAEPYQKRITHGFGKIQKKLMILIRKKCTIK
ncbi:MAG: Leucine-tRNA ligase [Berkelbacteria bacterium GW2011_GWB1_38_5]|uniref:Leucine--tRNA ligase n=1 Tax=Berkelbacteria bacterium GW2011_GWB1_38_5 TaxID=1618336 RepID=A0A0G0MLT1_9BACT|nr:MAG: Leucine-tRNA ligase [Berkelbacteria bacterium GW2011_GWB1_38_5]